LPAVTSLTGKAKFVHNASKNAEIKLGYVVDAAIAPLDTGALPKKYLPPAEQNAGVNHVPTTVTYDVVFYFILKDKDGFPLLKATSNREPVSSGTTNHFQLFANTYIPPAIAAGTQAIDIRMEAVKCLTCNANGRPLVQNTRKGHFFF
jgi:hypothetical protein